MTELSLYFKGELIQHRSTDVIHDAHSWVDKNIAMWVKTYGKIFKHPEVMIEIIVNGKKEIRYPNEKPKITTPDTVGKTG